MKINVQKSYVSTPQISTLWGCSIPSLCSSPLPRSDYVNGYSISCSGILNTVLEWRHWRAIEPWITPRTPVRRFKLISIMPIANGHDLNYFLYLQKVFSCRWLSLWGLLSLLCSLSSGARFGQKLFATDEISLNNVNFSLRYMNIRPFTYWSWLGHCPIMLRVRILIACLLLTL